MTPKGMLAREKGESAGISSQDLGAIASILDETVLQSDGGQLDSLAWKASSFLSSVMAQGDAISALMQLSMAGMGSRCIKRGSVLNHFVADRKEAGFCAALTCCMTALIGRFAVIDSLLWENVSVD